MKRFSVSSGFSLILLAYALLVIINFFFYSIASTDVSNVHFKNNPHVKVLSSIATKELPDLG